MIPIYLIWRLAFSRSGGLVRKERQAREVTSPAGWVPSESALRQTWSIRSGKSQGARLVWVVLLVRRSAVAARSSICLVGYWGPSRSGGCRYLGP